MLHGTHVELVQCERAAVLLNRHIKWQGVINTTMLLFLDPV